MNNSERTYLWISRWEDFQHYQPEPNRAPAWIKTYTKQLDDDDYRALTPVQRALLHDLRIAFAKANCKLLVYDRAPASAHRAHTENTASERRENTERTPSAHRALSQRIGYRVTSAQLKALSDAGFVQLVSRETLDARLAKLYASRAPARSQRSKRENEKVEAAATTDPGDPPPAAPETDAAAAELLDLLKQLNITGNLATRAATEPDRALAVAQYTIANGSGGGYFRTVFDSGDWPTTNDPTPTGDFDQNADRHHPCGLPNCPLHFHTAEQAADHRTYAHFTTHPPTKTTGRPSSGDPRRHDRRAEERRIE